ncbi:sulfotransferase family protein [Planktothrix paucivesiculata]|uniref:Sulfotransferase n=1 Tax=Planktothrix paucivesiculata PCC 9631 TaxID=671071 RepID=A0A7Z9BIY1_9CYAN|nr:sulfotransferase [Planktothrix paucivesiculata]VXD15161.1 hypothetical protein PL9631_1130010 [Planktothrix paucivesiculata PCC 9631]
MNHHQYVFIGGLHRSGTTLLANCLREHPKISGFKDTGVSEDEGQFLQSVYPPAMVYGGPGRFGFNSGSFLNETSDLASSENAQKMFQEWSHYWDLQRPILLEKSPPNLLKTRFLQALFPNSFFIIILRHPIPVAYATKKWSHTQLYSLIKHWLVCYEQFERDRPYLKRLLVLKYEDLIENPQLILNQIYTFIGVESVISNLNICVGVNDRYFNWWKDRQNLFKALYTDYIQVKFEKRVNRFGYSLRV